MEKGKGENMYKGEGEEGKVRYIVLQEEYFIVMGLIIKKGVLNVYEIEIYC